MTITDSYSESSYLADLTCNLDVRVHIGRSTGRSTPLDVTSSGEECQFHIPTVRAYIGPSSGRSPPVVASNARHHGMYIMGCIWQSFWILQEKVGICFYFLIFRVVISQLAL